MQKHGQVGFEEEFSITVPYVGGSFKSYIPVLSAGVAIFAGLVIFVCLFVSSSLQFSTLIFTLGLSSPVSATLGAGVTDVQNWDA